MFITIEGIEGAGKSTAVNIITDYLKEKEIDFIATREPGGTEIAEAIRQLLLCSYHEKMAEDTELLLMFASRAQHIAQVILPALNAQKVVICDRFTDASFAYQGGGRGVSEERIAILENWVQGQLRPDLTILLDVPTELGFKRINGRGGLDRIEQEKVHFFERVRACYLTRAERYSNRYRIINAAVSLKEMKTALIKVLQEFFYEE